MEDNLRNLQGILRNLTEKTGEFTKIKYKGGNEEKISRIVKTLQEQLTAKDFLIENKSNPLYREELRYITGLLLGNTEFINRGLWDLEDYSHLINSIPALSKCLLANLIVELDLAEHCCSIILNLEPILCEELFGELVNCLKQCEPRKALLVTHFCISTIIKIVAPLDADQNQQNQEIVDKLGDLCSEMLINMSRINADWLQEWKIKQVNEHLGYTFLWLLRLLQQCPLYLNSLSKITGDLIGVTINVIKAVTLNVFCCWAEVQHEYQPLQMVIAGEAYRTIEHLNKYKPAVELISMLATMAKKPKTINELVLEADTPTMINAINRCDDNQKAWFRALMTTQVLKSAETLACLDKWAHLCTAENVTRLLSQSHGSKENKVKILVMKCARSLNIKDLGLAIARYFQDRGTKYADSESLEEELTVLFNKAEHGSEIDENFIKDLFLLLLQNPEFLLTALYKQCLKKPAHSHYLQQVFRTLKVSVDVNNFSKNVFIVVFKNNPPVLENIMCYRELLNMLLSLGYFQSTTVLSEIFMPQLKEVVDKDNEMLVYSLQVLNMISLEHTLHQRILPFLILLGEIMDKYRCEFCTFSITNYNITREATDLLLKFIANSSDGQCMQYRDLLELSEPKKCINQFYFASLYNNASSRLLNHIYPEFHTSTDSQAVQELMALLPMCVTSEWILITSELETDCGVEKALKLLRDVLFLLCEFVNTQLKSNTNFDTNGMRFCLQQYGIVIKDVLQPKFAGLDNEILLVKNICSLMREFPEDIRKKEGLQLTVLCSDQALKSLKDDRDFILSLVAIGDTSISQLLAQRMLS